MASVLPVEISSSSFLFFFQLSKRRQCSLLKFGPRELLNFPSIEMMRGETNRKCTGIFAQRTMGAKIVFFYGVQTERGRIFGWQSALFSVGLFVIDTKREFSIDFLSRWPACENVDLRYFNDAQNKTSQTLV